MMKLFCISVIVFCAIVIVVGIVKIHELPGDIALKRGHPQAEAIRICSLLGLLIFPFWMLALLWAYMRPVFKPVSLDSVPTDSAPEAAVSADGGTA
jgi:uncharacterized membrane protein